MWNTFSAQAHSGHFFNREQILKDLGTVLMSSYILLKTKEGDIK